MFILNNEIARLIVLQRIELIGPILKRLRKILGRSIFTNFLSKYFLNSKQIGKNYHKIMTEEFERVKKSISDKDKNILSIGSGVGGFEVILNNHFKNLKFYFIEKNYISKKVVYSWDSNNKEAYNNLDLQKQFLIRNGINDINIYDFDKNNLPVIEYDLIISLFSLDYHYDFYLYLDYFKKVFTPNTKLIFDTIRPDHFDTIFNKIEVLNTFDQTVHKSKRLMCSGLKI
ncbi:MAG: hypothetical protein CBE49_002480 [Rickettsiales bacterium TMED289]|nr:MAG: hypothetical protein CBE49_002480 [Rickettsiales bacterium TMED289]